MNVHDLSPSRVEEMVRVDLANLTGAPDSPIGTFDFHGCLCGIASFTGRPPWELHTKGDELLHILAGETELTALNDDAAEPRRLRAGDLVIVPKGHWHSNDSPGGLVMLFMTPNDGNHHSFTDPRGGKE